MTNLERVLQVLVDTVDQLEQEVRRVRTGQSLSNAAGIRKNIEWLIAHLKQNEK